MAFLNALRYARERKAGSIGQALQRIRRRPRVPIIEHADIRRMLLDMKARVEGIRALICKLAAHRDRYDIATTDGVGDANYHLGQIELLTPVVKAYGSDQAFRICETAIQTLGGVGYTADYGIEQVLPRQQGVLDLRGHEPHPGDGPDWPQAVDAERRLRSGLPEGHQRLHRQAPRPQSLRSVGGPA